MKKKLDSENADWPDLCASTTLENSSNFQEEMGAMEMLILTYDHICLFSPKGHPELASCSIEYDWGVSKKKFQKDNNHVPKYCERDFCSSLKKVDLAIAFNTSRRACSYMVAYTNNYSESQLLIEKFVKIHKCYHNILDQETKYLNSLKVKIENNLNEMKEEWVSLKLEEESIKIKDEKKNNNKTKTKEELKKVCGFWGDNNDEKDTNIEKNNSIIELDSDEEEINKIEYISD